MGRRKRVTGILLLLLGCSLFWYPAAAQWRLDRAAGQCMAAFEEEDSRESGQPKETDVSAVQEEKEVLKDALLAYNHLLYTKKQAAFTDPWVVAQTPEVEGLEPYREKAFGYIHISAMETALPLYVGASASHMAHGAAVLGETSLPVGGENTNCVIAAHRGYRGAAFFRDIEKLQKGDTVEIRNPWEQLRYTVEEIKVIEPCDSEAVKIQKGRDMLTLLTCHPYRGHGKQRYVVFCIREETKAVLENPEGQSSEMAGQDRKTERIKDAGNNVRRENLMRKYTTFLLIVMCLWVLQSRRKGRRQIACTAKHMAGRQRKL